MNRPKPQTYHTLPPNGPSSSLPRPLPQRTNLTGAIGPQIELRRPYPSSQSHPSHGTPFSVPTPNGRDQGDRTYTASPAKSTPYGAYPNSSQGGGTYNSSQNDAGYARGSTGGHRSGGNQSASYGRQASYGRGGEGFDRRERLDQDSFADGLYASRDPSVPRLGAGANVESYRQAGLAAARANANVPAGFASVGSSSFHGTASTRDSPERRRREAQEVKMADPASVKAKAEQSRADQADAEARRRAAQKKAATMALPALKSKSLYDTLVAKSQTPTTLASSSSKDRQRPKSRQDSVEVVRDGTSKSKDKGKGKASYLEESASDDDRSTLKKKKSGKLSNFRNDGFNDDENFVTGEKSSNSSNDFGKPRSKEEQSAIREQGLAKAGSPTAPIISLEERMKAAAEAEEEEQLALSVRAKLKAKRMIVLDSDDEAADEQAQSAKKRRREASPVNSDFAGLVSDEDDDILRKAVKIDPETLCPFCNQPMPTKPSSYLLGLKKYLLTRPEARAAPSQANSLGVRLPPAQTASFCKQHVDERTTIPEGIKQGHPETIDWESVKRRIDRECLPYLSDIVIGKNSSAYFQRAKDDYGANGKKLRNAIDEFGSFHVEQPGYYGPRGQALIVDTLTSLFNDLPILTSSRTSPLPIDFYIRRVLVPECAISLIQRDRSLATRAEAEEVLIASKEYGVARFGLDSEEDRKASEERRGKEMAMEKEERRREREKMERGERSSSVEEDEENEGGEERRKRKKKGSVVELDGSSDEDEKPVLPPPPPKATGRKPKAFVEAEKAPTSSAGSSSTETKAKKAPSSSPPPVLVAKKKEEREPSAKGKEREREKEKGKAREREKDERRPKKDEQSSSKPDADRKQPGITLSRSTAPVSTTSSRHLSKSTTSSVSHLGFPPLATSTLSARMQRELSVSSTSDHSVVDESSDDEILNSSTPKTGFREEQERRRKKEEKERKEKMKRRRKRGGAGSDSEEDE